MVLLLPILVQYVAARGLRVATYNLENFGDTINHPGINDPLFTPEQYAQKLANLSRVVRELDADLLSVCEVENRAVLDDIVRECGVDYGIVHYESSDLRGIDVAILYRMERLVLLDSYPITPSGITTRDVVCAEFCDRGGDTTLIYAMHLPSKRGGSPAASRARVQIAATVAEQTRQQGVAKNIVVLGDMNENPSSSIVCRTFLHMHCATLRPWRAGQGSYAWRDVWQMYDNILVRPAVGSELAGDARVFAPPYLLADSGRYRGYPRKGEYSDHLPVYVEIIRQSSFVVRKR